MLDIKPHAADPEKTFSLMGWYHSARRSQLVFRTTTAMATIKMHHQSLKNKLVTEQLQKMEWLYFWYSVAMHMRCNIVTIIHYSDIASICT